MNFKKQTKKERGFAMIFTVLIVSLILSITLGMSSIAFKQRILSGLVKDSQIAFYQADSGSECGLLYDYNQGLFIKNTPIVPLVNDRLACGDIEMVFSKVESDKVSTSNDYFVFQQDPTTVDDSKPCFTIVFDKRDPGNLGKSVIDSRGYNICKPGIKQVERSIKVFF